MPDSTQAVDVQEAHRRQSVGNETQLGKMVQMPTSCRPDFLKYNDCDAQARCENINKHSQSKNWHDRAKF
jgi:hypothetical protein